MPDVVVNPGILPFLTPHPRTTFTPLPSSGTPSPLESPGCHDAASLSGSWPTAKLPVPIGEGMGYNCIKSLSILQPILVLFDETILSQFPIKTIVLLLFKLIITLKQKVID